MVLNLGAAKQEEMNPLESRMTACVIMDDAGLMRHSLLILIHRMSCQAENFQQGFRLESTPARQRT